MATQPEPDLECSVTFYLNMQDLNCPQQCSWGLWSSGVWHRVTGWFPTFRRIVALSRGPESRTILLVNLRLSCLILVFFFRWILFVSVLLSWVVRKLLWTGGVRFWSWFHGGCSLNGSSKPPDISNFSAFQGGLVLLESNWNVMAHGDSREKWRGNWRMERLASTLYTTSEYGVSSISTADAHTTPACSRLNWRPRRFKWTRPFRRKTKSGFCTCAITFQTQSTKNGLTVRIAFFWHIALRHAPEERGSQLLRRQIFRSHRDVIHFDQWAWTGMSAMTALLGPRHAVAPVHNRTETMTILTEVSDVFPEFILESVRQHLS